jgi:hypothetical protein
MVRPNIAECVDHGIALLDLTYPEWVSRIDVSRLDLGSESRCVLGQLFDKAHGWHTPFGPYARGVLELFGPWETRQVYIIVEHGFSAWIDSKDPETGSWGQAHR